MIAAKAWAERSPLERTAVAAIVISALQQLHGVCRAMETEHCTTPPTADQYEAAMQNAERVLALALNLPAIAPASPLTH